MGEAEFKAWLEALGARGRLDSGLGNQLVSSLNRLHPASRNCILAESCCQIK